MSQTIQQRFERFVTNNPKIVQLYVDYTRKAIANGFRNYSVSALTEIIRWHVRVESKGEKFKIPNSYRSRMSRYLVAKYPEFDGFFKQQRLRSA
jgi:hypothetical protein